jgi:hypothetical protein
VNVPWWHGLPPAQTTIPCTGRIHRLRWAAGEVRATDHEDADAQTVPPHTPCGRMLAVWDRHAADLTVLVLSSRGPADSLASGPGAPALPGPAAPLRPTRQGPGRGQGVHSVAGAAMPRAAGARTFSSDYTVPAGGELTAADDEFIALFALAPPMQDRLAATVIADWTRRLRDAGGSGPRVSAPALQAALYGRVTAALRAWTGRSGLLARVVMIGEADPPGLTRAGGRVTARLPFGWLDDVWAKGLATTGGRFCIAATPSDRGGWVLSTVGQAFGSPRATTQEFPPSDIG